MCETGAVRGGVGRLVKTTKLLLDCALNRVSAVIKSNTKITKCIPYNNLFEFSHMILSDLSDKRPKSLTGLRQQINNIWIRHPYKCKAKCFYVGLGSRYGNYCYQTASTEASRLWDMSTIWVNRSKNSQIRPNTIVTMFTSGIAMRKRRLGCFYAAHTLYFIYYRNKLNFFMDFIDVYTPVNRSQTK